MGVRSKSWRVKQIQRDIRNKTLVASEPANIGSQDRISQLPDHILHNIIFYLQNIKLERYFSNHNSILNFVLSSKACHRAWLFHPHPTFFGMRYLDDDSEKEKSFRDHLDRYLLRMMSHGLDITSFSLHTKFSKPMHLTSWLEGLDVLKLKIIQFDFHDGKFKMSMSLFSYISTLEEISLHNCILESYQLRNQDIRLPSLLRLRMVDIDADSDTIEGIIRGCPSLNQLEILFFDFIPDIDGNVYALDIDAPCLRKFSCQWTRNVVPCFSVSSCSDLKELSLMGIYVVDDKTLEKLLSQLTNLECLSITYSHTMSNQCISSFSITKLKLDETTISGVMRIDCPNLLEFSYRTYTVPHLHHQSTWDWKLSLYLRGLSYLRSRTNKFFEKLGSFISDTKI